MVEGLLTSGQLTEGPVAEALRSVPRHVFVPAARTGKAYEDTPLDIGSGQTISAPHMVALMLEVLELQPGHHVLEVGGGSGYHAAVAAEIVGEEGHVWTVERVPELAGSAREHLEAAGVGDRVTVVLGDGSEGLPDHAPYDRIWVAAAAPDLPPPLLDQMAAPGRLLVPVGDRRGQELLLVARDGKGQETRQRFTRVRFVPLLGRFGF